MAVKYHKIPFEQRQPILYLRLMHTRRFDRFSALFSQFNTNSSPDPQFLYRLTTCPDLSLGLFFTTDSSSTVANTPTYPTARAPDSFSPNLKSVLIAHVISTKTTAPGVTNGSMEIPSGSQALFTSGGGDEKGHKKNGRTLALHSLAVLPSFQNQGFGKMILKSYMQRMSTSGVADRIALLAHDGLVKYYESVGFVNDGQSDVTFGGGGWYSMVRLNNLHRRLDACAQTQYSLLLTRLCRFMSFETRHLVSAKNSGTGVRSRRAPAHAQNA